MRRRDLIGLFAGSAALGPRVARAQQRLVGVLWATTPELNKAADAALRRGLAEAGFVEGPNLASAARYANGDNAQLPALASELAALKPNLIVAAGTITALAAHRAAPDVPIVALLDLDGVAQGVFRSYTRPEGMVTGLTVIPSELVGKNFEILREIVPGLRSIGFMFRPDTPVAAVEPAARAAAQHLGLAYVAFPMRSMDEVKAAFSSGDADAMFTVPTHW
jgi:putative ABC transport system substrate-binding protein